MPPPPPLLFHSPLEVDLKTVCCIDFYPYISRPVYGQIIFHSIFKICGRIRMVWSLKWNLFSTSTWYYLFSTLFWRLSLWMKSYCYQSNETSSAVLSHGTYYLFSM